MYLNDPTLYGATLPQREFPFPTPFFNQFFPQQPMPWQGFQKQAPPVFPQQLQHHLPIDYQNLPFGYQNPPFGYQQPPFGYQQPPFGYQQPPFGYQQPFMTPPHAQPAGLTPHFQGGFPNFPFYNWQRPF